MRLMLSSILFASVLAGRAGAAHVPIRITDVWSRPSSGTAVVYATIHNESNVADQLIGAASPVATHVDFHESVEARMPAMPTGSGSMGNMPMNASMTSMKTLAAIPIPAGATIGLKPGGYHLMLDLRHDLASGEKIPLRLHFAHAGWIAVTATVQPMR